MRSKLHWAESVHSPHSDVLEWHRALIRLRRRYPALTDGRLSSTKVRFDEAAGWLIMVRGSLAVVCNLSGGAQRIPCPELAAKAIVMSSDTGAAIDDDTLVLPEQSVAILARIENRCDAALYPTQSEEG